jgi:malonyl-CoA decarboxylase
LRRRLGADRRVFVWTHPSLPGEPLVALHVALCAAMPTRMADILGDPRLPPPPPAAAGGDHQLPPPANGGPDPTAAVFYSISSTQPGLAGIDLGNDLIKRAAAALRAEAPSLRTLCTLSPLPGCAGRGRRRPRGRRRRRCNGPGPSYHK